MSKESHEAKITRNVTRFHKDQWKNAGDAMIRGVAFGDPEAYGTHAGEGRKVKSTAEKEWRRRYPGYDLPGYVHKPRDQKKKP